MAGIDYNEDTDSDELKGCRSKDLLDAHFARALASALAHVLSGLRQLKLNQTAKIATCRGPLQARSLGLGSPTTLSSLSRWTSNCSTTLATSQLQRSRR